jgi:DNA-binding transcriptional MocR family regulator
MQGTRTEAVMTAIRQRIAARALAPGDRVPSVRGFARSMGVSPSTVAEAYDRLAAEGTIRARRGAGFFVTAANLPPLALAEAGAPRDRVVDPFWVSRQALDADPSVLKPGCGWLPADWMPGDAIRRALRAVARGGDTVLCDYGSTQGSAAVRRILLARFAEEGIAAAPGQVMLTGSGTEAIDLICRLLLRPGDAVLVDDPCYFNFQALLRAHQVRIVGVPFTPAGPDVAAFERVVAAEGPRLYITNSALHNPTGATVTPATAHRVLAAATRHGVTVVEDDIFADFEPAPSPRLAVLDGLDRVIRIGSFSKTLSASIRCGYVAARADWIERLVDLQIATRFGGPGPLATELIAAVLAGGGYRRHMDEVRQRLVRARSRATERLAALGIVPAIVPRGGFYLWCRLPDGIDSTDLARRCIADDIVLAPGNVFSVSRTAGPFLRFNVAQMDDDRVSAALERAIAAGRAP